VNSYFNAGDWAIIIVYLLGIIALGVWFGKDQRNTRDYFLGSKSVPWWGIGLSIVAAETSALTIIGVPAMAYGGNIAFLQMIIGYVIARILLAIVPTNCLRIRLAHQLVRLPGASSSSAKRSRRACASMSPASR
jgi:Na+/proline symporter